VPEIHSSVSPWILCASVVNISRLIFTTETRSAQRDTQNNLKLGHYQAVGFVDLSEFVGILMRQAKHVLNNSLDSLFKNYAE
jgi:hypothetical protein